MIITICSSMTLADRIREVQSELQALGHTVYIPVENETFDYLEASDRERAALKREHDLIREHWRKIQRSEGILVLNEDIKGIPSYVGGNSFPGDGIRTHPGPAHLHDAGGTGDALPERDGSDGSGGHRRGPAADPAEGGAAIRRTGACLMRRPLMCPPDVGALMRMP